MSAPVVGIEVDLEPSPTGRRYAKCYEAYFDTIAAEGGVPVLMPPVSDAKVLQRQLDLIDALVVPGGDDFHASEWGEAQHACSRFTPCDPRRLVAGRRLVQAALERGLPFLGVCYGEQLLNLLRGGSLVQDVPDAFPEAIDHRAEHGLRVAEGTLLARLTGGGDGLTVNSRHHQAVRTPGEGLRICAWAPDGVVEAIEAADGRFVLGVQWHPEGYDGPTGSGLFAGLIEAAREARAAR